MTKKILGLGALALAVAIPVAAVVSCSSTITPTMETEKAKLVTPMKSLKTDVTAEAAATIINKNEEGRGMDDFYPTVELAAGFGITLNLNNPAKANKETNTVAISVALTDGTETQDVTISLTGFEAEKIILTGVVVKPDTKEIIATAVAAVTDSTTDTTLLAALSPVFEGLDTNNIANLTAAVVDLTIVITANDGFIFENNKATLTTEVKDIVLNVTLKVYDNGTFATALISVRDALALPIPNNQVLLDALKPIFTGLTLEMITNLEVTSPSVSIVITTKPGFTFNDGSTILTATKLPA